MFNTSPKKRHAGPSKERVSTERKDPLNIRHLPSSNHNKGPGKKSFQKMFINKMCLEHSKAVRDQHGAKTSAMNSPDHSSKFFYLSPESKFRQSLHDDAFTAQFGKRSSIFEDSRPINIESHPKPQKKVSVKEIHDFETPDELSPMGFSPFISPEKETGNSFAKHAVDLTF